MNKNHKAVKKAVDYYKGVWPDCDFLFVYYKDSNAEIFDRIERETDDFFSSDKKFVITRTPLTHTGKLSCGPRFIVEKQQFEDYVRENKMEKQKYKYVNAGIKTVGEFIDRVMSGEKIYKRGLRDEQFVIEDGKVMLYAAVWDIDAIRHYIDCKDGFDTRQALPWYEVEGVFPCLVRRKGTVHVASMFEHGGICTTGGSSYSPEDCKPLTPSEAAKYGVE